MSLDIRLKNPRTHNLSNLAAHRFIFRGIEVASMEGLLQALKSRSIEVQRYRMTLSGMAAKLSGANQNWQKTQTLWWQGKPMKRRSKDYQEFLDEAYLALFTQNEEARAALLATGSATLTHTLGKRNENETVLTRREFTSRLTRIRAMLQRSQI